MISWMVVDGRKSQRLLGSPDHCCNLLGDFVGAHSLVEINQAKIFELGELFQGTLDIVHVGGVVLGVMNGHRLRIDVGLQCIVAIRQRW